MRIALPNVCALFLLAFAPVLCAGELAAHMHSSAPMQIGKVTFPNSGSPSAQEPFQRGMALLHSYQYYDARTAFHDASMADPSFALAYWAEAFTYSQFDWGVEDLPGAQSVLARLAPTREERLAKAHRDNGRAFGTAVEAFLQGQGTPIERARAFSVAMNEWSANAPADVEAMAFAARAALYVMRYAPPSESLQSVEEAIARAEKVVAANPDHPGGLHYLIHATDSPRFAERGLAAARRYDKLAPDADHALHMPSHIYLQLGMWSDVSLSNERAWEASRDWVKRGGHPVTMLGWHSLQWLQYSYLQEGRYRQARELINLAKKILSSTPADTLADDPDTQFAVETMEFQYGNETGDWSQFPARVEDARRFTAQAIAASSIRERQRAVSAASHVVAAFVGQRDRAAARDALEAMRTAINGRQEDDPTRKMVTSQAAQLDAAITKLRGDRAGAVQQYRDLAGQAIAAGIMPIGPPSSLPLSESLGAALMDTQQFSEAVSAYERALAERPNRSLAVLGLARARKAAGDLAGASEAYAQLVKNWAHADAKLPAVAEAKANAASIH